MTTKNKTLPLRLPESLIKLADLYSREQRTDRSTTLRQWLYQGAEEYALKLVEAGRISAGRAAELLDLSIYDIYDKAKARGLEIGSTPEQFRESMKYAALLKPRGKSRNDEGHSKKRGAGKSEVDSGGSQLAYQLPEP